MKMESLLEGTYDLHVHAAPDVVPRVTDIVRLSKTAVDKKMGGLLIKDHTTSTTGRVFVLNQVFGGSCRFFISLVRNSTVGFVYCTAVESARPRGEPSEAQQVCHGPYGPCCSRARAAGLARSVREAPLDGERRSG